MGCRTTPIYNRILLKLGEPLSLALRLTQSAYSPTEDPTRGTKHMEVDREETEDTMM